MSRPTARSSHIPSTQCQPSAMRCTGRRAHILSISLTDSFQPTERQLSTRFGGGVPRRWRRLDSSSEELLGAAGGCEVNAFVGAVAERFRVGPAAAAERDRVACLEPVAFGVEESDVALNEVGAVVGRSV